VILIIVLPFVTAEPECKCNAGFIYPLSSGSTDLTSKISSGTIGQDTITGFDPVPAGNFYFKDCITPDAATVKCTNGVVVGETPGVAGTPTGSSGTFDGVSVPGSVSALCVKGPTTGTLLTGSIDQALAAAGVSGEDHSDHASACCGQCNKGYRLQKVEQGGVIAGYICIKQVCADGTADGFPDAPKCTCGVGFFNSNRGVSDLDKASPEEILGAGDTRSTAAEWGAYAAQGSCIAYDAADHCFKPDNCAVGGGSLCQSNNKPFATLCSTCDDGFNLQRVKCTDGSSLSTGAIGDIDVCHTCELTTFGCNNGQRVLT